MRREDPRKESAMPCPHRNGLFERVPGKTYVSDARELRTQFLDGTIDVGEFLQTYAWTFPKSREARFKNQVASYATASLVIEQLWRSIDKKKWTMVLAHFASRFQHLSHAESVQGFTRYFNALLDTHRDRFMSEMHKRNRGGTKMSSDDERLICFLAVARKRSRSISGSNKLPMPSMADLVMMLGRLAQVAPEVFLRDLGRHPEKEELFALLRDPYIRKLLSACMTRDRSSLYPLIARLENTKKADLNIVERTFDPKCFEIRTDGASHFLRLTQNVVEEDRTFFLRAEQKRMKRKKAPPQILGCPALYTGLLGEMYTWVLDEFEKWYEATA